MTLTCDTSRLTRIAIDFAVAISVLYFGITCCFLLYKLRAFNRLPYSRRQSAIVFYRFQVQLDVSIADLYALLICMHC